MTLSEIAPYFDVQSFFESLVIYTDMQDMLRKGYTQDEILGALIVSLENVPLQSGRIRRLLDE